MKKRTFLRLFMCTVLIVCTVCMGTAVKQVSAEDAYTIIQGSNSSTNPVAIMADNVLYAVEYKEDEAMYFTLTTGAQSGYYFFYVYNASCDGEIEAKLTNYVTGEEVLRFNNYRGISKGEYEERNKKLLTNTTYNFTLYDEYEDDCSGYVMFKIGFVPDYVGDTKEQATGISLGQTISSSIDGEDDEDWYQVTTAEAGKYVFTLQSQNNSAGNTQGCSYVISNSINDSLISGTVYSSDSEEETISLLGNSTYYIKIEEYGGYYPCNYSFTFSSKYKQSTTVTPTTPTVTTPTVTAPSKVKNLKLAYYWSNLNECEYTWSTVDGADGYQVEIRSVKGNKKLLKKTTSSNYIYCKIYGNGRFIKVRVRAYKNNAGTKVYGKWSSYNCAAATKSGTARRSSNGKKIALTWKKVTGVTSYKLYISTKNGKGYKKVATLSGNKTKYVIKKYAGKKLKKGKTYYIKMVYVTKVGGKKKTSSVISTWTSYGL